jgi:hypothetical protein
VREAISRLNPHAKVRFVDTASYPTKAYQAEVGKLAGLVEAMVVGGRSALVQAFGGVLPDDILLLGDESSDGVEKLAHRHFPPRTWRQ